MLSNQQPYIIIKKGIVMNNDQKIKIRNFDYLNKNILKCKKGELPLTDLIKELYEKLEKEEPILYILNRL